MRDIKQAFRIACQNFSGWGKNPRIWMTFILAAVLCLMLSDQIISHAIKYETILQVFEPFIWTYGDASSVMLLSAFDSALCGHAVYQSGNSVLACTYKTKGMACGSDYLCDSGNRDL